jgi:hypothetical protein
MSLLYENINSKNSTEFKISNVQTAEKMRKKLRREQLLKKRNALIKLKNSIKKSCLNKVNGNVRKMNGTTNNNGSIMNTNKHSKCRQMKLKLVYICNNKKNKLTKKLNIWRINF